VSRPRRRLAAVITFGVTLALTAGLGSPLAGDHLDSRGNALLARLISGVRFPQWTSRRPAGSSVLEWVTPMIADILLAVLVAAVAMLVVSARTRLSALLAGWGLTMVLAAAIGAGRVFALLPVDHPGSAVYATAGTAITTGLWFGLATGWLNGAVLAATVRKTADPAAADDPAAAQVEPVRIWSPTQPDWQHTQDLHAVTTQSPFQQTAGPPFPTAQQPVQPAPPTQPWPPASAPGS
jgi:hypothetical protein